MIEVESIIYLDETQKVKSMSKDLWYINNHFLLKN